MNKETAKRLLVIAALATLLPTAALATPPEVRGQCGSLGKGAGDCACDQSDGDRHLGGMAAKLQLTDTQREQVRAILAAERDRTAPLKAGMRQEGSALRAAIHAGTADEATIRAQLAVQAENKADLLVGRAAVWQKINALLTPEQRELAADNFAARGANGQGKRGRGCRNGDQW